VGDPADFIVVRDLKQFELVATYLDGVPVFADGQCRFPRADCPAINRFAAEPLSVDRFQIVDRGGQIRVIQAHDGELFTDEIQIEPRRESGQLISDVERGLLKIAVVNRYAPAPPAVAFIRGFGLKRGAIAASVAHDSHNIVAVGADDNSHCAAVNAVIANRGGLAVVSGTSIEKLPLEVAGLMSRDGHAVAHRYAELDRAARGLGSPLTAPFMTLSFMALLVIPSLKISDRGLFDGSKFEPVSLFV
jgi:adenine deaminase